jgi:chaperonin cofactor prefoldin
MSVVIQSSALSGNELLNGMAEARPNAYNEASGMGGYRPDMLLIDDQFQELQNARDRQVTDQLRIAITDSLVGNVAAMDNNADSIFQLETQNEILKEDIKTLTDRMISIENENKELRKEVQELQNQMKLFMET